MEGKIGRLENESTRRIELTSADQQQASQETAGREQNEKAEKAAEHGYAPCVAIVVIVEGEDRRCPRGENSHIGKERCRRDERDKNSKMVRSIGLCPRVASRR